MSDEHDGQRRKQAIDAAQIEARDVDRAGRLDLVQQQAGDQIAAEEEEDGDAELTWDDPTETAVTEDNNQDRGSTDAV